MKYYLTYYEAYPIYEPAEGGYYYEGRNCVEWAESESLIEIVNYSIPNYLNYHLMVAISINSFTQLPLL